MKQPNRYYGKYRGTVENNVDPMQLSRIQISCPSVLGEGKLSWAMPCTPYAGDGVGLFMLPPEGSYIWVEFEGGDPDYPIWSGCFWGTGQVPASPATENIKMLKTDTVELKIDDMDSVGGLTLIIDEASIQNTIELTCNSDGVKLTIGDSVLTMTIEDIKAAFAEDSSARLSADGMELKGNESTGVLNTDGIVFTGKEHTITFSEDGIELVASESSVTMTSDSIESVNGSSSVAIASDSVTVTGDSSEGIFDGSGIELANSGGNVTVKSSKFDVNDGAMEVV